MTPRLLTIGHSIHPIEEFVAMLQAHGVKHLVDVRTVPRSRRNAQFNKESLPKALTAAGIQYTHMPGLGGLRKPRKNSTNTAWRNESFRGYADYMQTEEFERNLQQLLRLAEKEATAVMCAESVPWRCHRSLIADAVTARGGVVEHIMTATRRDVHKLIKFARVEGGRVSYPPEQADLFKPS